MLEDVRDTPVLAPTPSKGVESGGGGWRGVHSGVVLGQRWSWGVKARKAGVGVFAEICSSPQIRPVDRPGDRTAFCSFSP